MKYMVSHINKTLLIYYHNFRAEQIKISQITKNFQKIKNYS